MLGYIMVYIGGIATGAALLISNRICVQKAVEIERKKSRSIIANVRDENRRLIDELNRCQCNNAYSKGVSAGRKTPMSDAERFAESFEGKTVTFRDTSKKIS